MKKYIIPIVIIIILIIGIVAVVAAAKKDDTVSVADSVKVSDVLVNATTSSSTAGTVNKPIAVNPGAQEKISNYVFTCSKDKTIETKIYENGKSPRAEIRLIDTSNKTGPQESRFFILGQKFATQGIRYATDGDTIVLVIINNRATFEENGLSTFRNCELTNWDH